VIGDVIRLPLSVPLRKGLRVVDPIGVEGVIVGFKSTTRWAFRRPSRISWVIVKTDDGLQSYRSAAELRVVEKTTTNHHQEAQKS
jgi:hypothetical protein